MASSIIAGGIGLFMAYVVSQAFNAFAQYPLILSPQSAKDALLHGVGLASPELITLGTLL
jgi:ATP-binding cassette, subfamily B (MDR/TAP), member 1